MLARKCFTATLQCTRGYKKSLVPTLVAMKGREKRVGGKPKFQRNEFIEWDFNREVTTFCRRFGIVPSTRIRDAFVSESYVNSEKQNREKFGLDSSDLVSNKEMVLEGLSKLKTILQTQIKASYPTIPTQAVEAVRDYLCSSEVLAEIAQEMGLNPLIMHNEGSTANPELLEKSLLSIIAATENVEQFVQSYILAHLMGKDLYDIWNPKDASFLLNSILKQKNMPEFEARMIFESGRNTIEPVFYVGVYSDKKMLGKGAAAGQTQAVEVAVADALRRIFRITRADRSPFERMAIDTLSAKMASAGVA